MEKIIELLDKFGPAVFVPLGGFAIVGILAQWSLYDKCGLKGIDCIIPVKNVITFLKIMGRPAFHSAYVIVPPPIILGAFLFLENPTLQYGIAALFFIPWAFFMIKVYIELCQSFGHYKLTDYILCVAFNGFYVLHLGLSYGEKYKGPVYGQKDDTPDAAVNGQLA
ncbi:DUF5684 domain-containing protein [Salibacteraceae bacterium]|jgi:hypothetical protein|nr:DUF5684 domain-containing protein [Salibacteraceae bacterium]